MNFKLKGYSGGIHDLAAKVRRAAGASPSRRKKIAAEIGLSVSTLNGMLRKLKRRNRATALARKGRSDKGQPRALPEAWAQAALIELVKGPAQYSRIYRRLLIQCDRLGIRPPSYSTFRRAISERFRKVFSSSGIRRIGDFYKAKRGMR